MDVEPNCEVFRRLQKQVHIIANVFQLNIVRNGTPADIEIIHIAVDVFIRCNILLVRYSACSMSSLNSLRPPTIIRFSFSVEEIKHFFGSNQEVIVYVMSKIQSVNTRQSR